MKNRRKLIRITIIPAVLITALLFTFLLCRRSSICGETLTDRAEYAKSLGYTVSRDSETVRNIVIPAVFSNVYENYNALQRECGFDLSPYKGEAAMQYTYTVSNYTDDSGNTLDDIIMDLIVCDGKIIGGDICSAELDGFMTGLQPRKK